MLESIIAADQSLFLILHSPHAPWLDVLMWYVSEKLAWIPLYAILLYLLYKKYPGRKFVLVILCIAASVTLNDRISSGLFKNSVARLRPSHEPKLETQIQFVEEPNGQIYRGGLYGFYSSHAANYAGIVTLFLLLMRPFGRIGAALLILWVLLIGYSRIYLGVHYPGDVIVGFIMGTFIGWICHKLFQFGSAKFFPI